jgi:hypothetical protein
VAVFRVYVGVAYPTLGPELVPGETTNVDLRGRMWLAPAAGGDVLLDLPPREQDDAQALRRGRFQTARKPSK